VTQADSRSEPTPDGPRRGWRVAAATIVVGLLVALWLPGVLGAVDHPVPQAMKLGPPVPSSTTPSTPTPTAPAEPPAAGSELTPPPPTTVPPAPGAAGPTTTVTTARPARNAPRATTTTTATGTVESRGAAALALINYPWQRAGYSMVFTGANPNLLGLTEPSKKRITIYLRPNQSTSDVARIIGHEIGHAVDFTMTTDAERADYRRIRSLDNRAWYPACGACPDYASPVGDWAETFAYWLLGDGSFNSQLAPKPTPVQLAALTPIFTADAAAAPTTTTTTVRPATPPVPKTTTTTTASGGTAAPGYGYPYGYGYRRAAPSGSGGRSRRR
jgi:hypothetical protein